MAKLTKGTDMSGGDDYARMSLTPRHAIGPRGNSSVFVTSTRGYTHFNVEISDVDTEAEFVLTWLEANNTPKFHKMTIARPGHSVWFMDRFEGARVTVTNHSQVSNIFILISADAD